MIISNAALEALHTGYKVLFNKTFSETKPLYNKVAMTVTSSNREQTYAWLGASPACVNGWEIVLFKI